MKKKGSAKADKKKTTDKLSKVTKYGKKAGKKKKQVAKRAMRDANGHGTYKKNRASIKTRDVTYKAQVLALTQVCSAPRWIVAELLAMKVKTATGKTPTANNVASTIRQLRRDGYFVPHWGRGTRSDEIPPAGTRNKVKKKTSTRRKRVMVRVTCPVCAGSGTAHEH